LSTATCRQKVCHHKEEECTIKTVADHLEKFFGQVSWIVGLGVIVMMAGVVREAVGRYFFNSPTQWVIELSGYLMVALVFLGGAYTYLNDGHVRVDMIYLRSGRKVRRCLDFFGYLVVLSYSIVLMWQSWNMAWGSFGSKATSMDAGIPLFPVQATVPLGCLFLSVAVLIKICRFFLPATVPDATTPKGVQE